MYCTEGRNTRRANLISHCQSRISGRQLWSEALCIYQKGDTEACLQKRLGRALLSHLCHFMSLGLSLGGPLSDHNLCL